MALCEELVQLHIVGFLEDLVPHKRLAEPQHARFCSWQILVRRPRVESLVKPVWLRDPQSLIPGFLEPFPVFLFVLLAGVVEVYDALWPEHWHRVDRASCQEGGVTAAFDLRELLLELRLILVARLLTYRLQSRAPLWGSLGLIDATVGRSEAGVGLACRIHW